VAIAQGSEGWGEKVMIRRDMARSSDRATTLARQLPDDHKKPKYNTSVSANPR
jgi:hypothetical protein